MTKKLLTGKPVWLVRDKDDWGTDDVVIGTDGAALCYAKFKKATGLSLEPNGKRIRVQFYAKIIKG